MAKQFDLITVGNISLDTIKIDGKGMYKNVPGGSAPAVVTAAAACNPTRVGVVSKIGQDYPMEHYVDLTSRGIDVTGISAQKTTCRFEMHYDEKGGLKKFKEIFNVEDALSLTDVPDDYFNARHFHLSAAHPKNQQKFLSSSKIKGTKSITLWPAYEEELSPYFKSLLNQANILFCNVHEIKMLSREENIYDAAKKVAQRGPKIIVLTKGAKGSAIYHKGQFHVFPALRTSFSDPTGAGDSFAGGFLSEYLSSKDVEKAGWYGVALASFTISKIGSWFPTIKCEKVDERIKRAKELLEKGQKSKPTLMDFF